MPHPMAKGVLIELPIEEVYEGIIEKQDEWMQLGMKIDAVVLWSKEIS